MMDVASMCFRLVTLAAALRLILIASTTQLTGYNWWYQAQTYQRQCRTVIIKLTAVHPNLDSVQCDSWCDQNAQIAKSATEGNYEALRLKRMTCFAPGGDTCIWPATRFGPWKARPFRGDEEARISTPGYIRDWEALQRDLQYNAPYSYLDSTYSQSALGSVAGMVSIGCGSDGARLTSQVDSAANAVKVGKKMMAVCANLIMGKKPKSGLDESSGSSSKSSKKKQKGKQPETPKEGRDRDVCTCTLTVKIMKVEFGTYCSDNLVSLYTALTGHGIDGLPSFETVVDSPPYWRVDTIPTSYDDRYDCARNYVCSCEAAMHPDEGFADISKCYKWLTPDTPFVVHLALAMRRSPERFM